MSVTTNSPSFTSSKKQSSVDKNIPKSLGRLKDVLQNEDTVNIDRLQQYESNVGKIVKIPINEIELDENIRSRIDTESPSFKSLLSSITKHGIQQNIVVELRSNENNYRIVCVAGHRRVTAALIAGTIKTIPALIKKFEKTDFRTEHALMENLLREDLHCLDIAAGYKDLTSKGWSREKLSKAFGKSDRTIHTYLKMAEWDEKSKNIIYDHPEIFTAKTLTRKIACRKFSSEKELADALRALLKTNEKTSIKISKKDTLAQMLGDHLSEKKYKPEIRNAILATFKELKLIN